jgi:hypothetical protein
MPSQLPVAGRSHPQTCAHNFERGSLKSSAVGSRLASPPVLPSCPPAADAATASAFHTVQGSGSVRPHYRGTVTAPGCHSLRDTSVWLSVSASPALPAASVCPPVRPSAHPRLCRLHLSVCLPVRPSAHPRLCRRWLRTGTAAWAGGGPSWRHAAAPPLPRPLPTCLPASRTMLLVPRPRPEASPAIHCMPLSNGIDAWLFSPRQPKPAIQLVAVSTAVTVLGCDADWS